MSINFNPQVPVARTLAVRLSARLRELTKRTARVSGCSFREVTLALVGEPEIRRLNRRYRKHDRVTDVLSFTLQSKPVVGELIICLAQAERQAKRRRHSLAHELDVLITHGLLHLAGYDHIRIGERAIMRRLEQAVLM